MMPLAPAGSAAARGLAFTPATLGFMRAGLLMSRAIPYLGTAVAAAGVLQQLLGWDKSQDGVPAHQGFHVACGGAGTVYTSWGGGGPTQCGTSGWFFPAGHGVLPDAFAYWAYTGVVEVQPGILRGTQAGLWQRDTGYTGAANPVGVPPVFLPFPVAAAPGRREPAIAGVWAPAAAAAKKKAAPGARGVPLTLPRFVPRALQVAFAEALRDAQTDVRLNALPGERGADRGLPMVAIPGAGSVPDRRPAAPAIPVAGAVPGTGVRPVVIPEAAIAGVVPLSPAIPGVRAPVIPGIGTAVIVTPQGRVLSRPVVLARPMSRTAFARPGGELKARVFWKLHGLRMGFSAATEPQDLLKALWKAVPPCARSSTPKMRSQAQKARANGWNSKYSPASPGTNAMVADIASYLQKLRNNPNRSADSLCSSVINPVPGVHRKAPGSATDEFANKALAGILDNEFKDYAFGRMGREMGNISRGLNTPFGIQMMKRISETTGM